MPLTHTRPFRVRHYECDVHGRLRAASYLRYMQEAAFDASAAAGYDLAHYETLERWNVQTCQRSNVPTCQRSNPPLNLPPRDPLAPATRLHVTVDR
jgi:hypothetical protein